MNDTQQHIKKLQLKIWLSKSKQKAPYLTFTHFLSDPF